jgi:phospholipid/cholesterol/gamma-HCH transport system substrate-binding protein
MKRYHHETVAGIFVLIGLLCVGYLTVKLGDVRVFDADTYPLCARFSSVSGLRVGNPVEMLGIEVGRVEGFRMDQENQVVLVELSIRKGIQVYDDAIASIKTAGLIGDKYISLDAGGAGEVLKPEGVIRDTQPPIDLTELIGKYAFGSVTKE